MYNLNRKGIVLGILFFIVIAWTAPALAQVSHEGDGAAMVADLVVVRPLSLAATAIGCVAFVASLPFTVWSAERLSKAGHYLVKEPGSYTFVRPIGEFD